MKKSFDTKQKVYDFILDFQKKNKISPTIREIANSFGFCIATVQYHLASLKKENKITYIPRFARTIRVIDAE